MALWMGRRKIIDKATSLLAQQPISSLESSKYLKGTYFGNINQAGFGRNYRYMMENKDIWEKTRLNVYYIAAW